MSTLDLNCARCKRPIAEWANVRGEPVCAGFLHAEREAAPVHGRGRLMGAETKIEWTDHTWNPWIGCSRVSPGCVNCYAESYGRRFGVEWGPGKPRRRTSADNWRQPLAWDRAAQRDGVRRRVFCASLADWADHEVPQSWRDDMWGVVDRCRGLDWLMLTKRPELAGSLLPWGDGQPWPHVWCGTTTEDQERWDLRIPQLLALNVAHRFVSAEPLLGPIEMPELTCTWCMASNSYTPDPDDVADCMHCGEGSALRWPRSLIEWVIVGGESGPHARMCDPAWIRSVVQQRRAAGVPVHVKQLGTWHERHAQGCHR